jgi:2-polyprenyl-6-methoxyphenol hydroxylase-like FAD-dependent oxidoreductase
VLDATQDVEYLRGGSIADLVQTGDAVAVTFASGVTRAFDLVVGADGLHSVTRWLVFGDGNVRDLGQRVSVFSVPNHLGLDREELTYVGPGRTVLMYSTAQDTGAKAMFLFADEGPMPEDGRAYLAEKYRDEGWAVPTLLDGMADAQDFYLDTLSQVHLDRWSAGRVALVGDAALRDFVRVNQALGPANAKRMVLSSRAGVWFAMTFLALLSKLPGSDRLIAKAVEPIHRAANAITLDEYVRTLS